ncbi:MAG: hypothetical protein ACM3Q1_07765 [Bacteroidales bacterium]
MDDILRNIRSLPECRETISPHHGFVAGIRPVLIPKSATSHHGARVTMKWGTHNTEGLAAQYDRAQRR